MGASEHGLGRWLSIPRPNPFAVARIVLFPFAGASVIQFYQWAAQLPSRFELVCVHLPGREARSSEAAAEDLRGAAAIVAEALACLPPKPSVYFGHSMGALLAYETCCAARERAAGEPYLVVVSGRSAPQVVLERTPYWEWPRPAFLEELFKLGGLTRDILELPELLDYVEPILRADLAMHGRYVPAMVPPLRQPVLALYGSTDHTFPPEQVLRWRECSTGLFQTVEFAGGHFFINEHRAAVLDKLTCMVDRFLPNSDQFI
jgi:pyochelin biosynthetic protein PchC